MRVLLDTHAFLWYITANSKLGKQAERVISDGRNQVYISKASLWEIAIKVSKGKLKLEKPYQGYIDQQIESNRFMDLGIEQRHLNRLISLPDHHQDPFDRLLIAQAISEEMPILTVDRFFSSYPVEIIW